MLLMMMMLFIGFKKKIRALLGMFRDQGCGCRAISSVKLFQIRAVLGNNESCEFTLE